MYTSIITRQTVVFLDFTDRRVSVCISYNVNRVKNASGVKCGRLCVWGLGDRCGGVGVISSKRGSHLGTRI